MRTITVATEQQEQTEALYVNGKLVSCDQTIYASEIAEAANGEVCKINHRMVIIAAEFPEDETDLINE